MEERVTAKTQIVAVVRKGDKVVSHKTTNLITNDGDLHMAEKLAGDTPTVAFANCYLGTGSTAAGKTDNYDSMTVISGTEKAPSTGYPKTNDTDTDNTGKGTDVCTWKYEWATTDFNNAAVREGGIAKASATTGDKLFNRWVWGAAFEKASDATLTLYVNVTITGA